LVDFGNPLLPVASVNPTSVKFVAQVKLLPSPEQAESLLATIQTFNAACDWLAERARQLDVYSQFRLQNACYKAIRLLFGLSAQAACLVCAKVADAYKKSKSPRTFRLAGAITYDLRLLSWNLEESRVSIWARNSRGLYNPFPNASAYHE
jgi:putative transposase